MADMFTLDQRELKQLLKFYKHAPRKFNAAAAGMLNSFAFGTKHEAEKKINENLTVRNPAFVKSSIRVNKTRIGPLNTLQSQTYSVKRPRFSGWIEQETGQTTTRKRVQPIAGREHNWQNKLKTGVRMKPDNYFHEPKEFRSKFAKTRGQKFVAMTEAIRTGKAARKPFIIKTTLPGNLSKFKRGLYIFEDRGTTTYSNKSKNKAMRGKTRQLKGRFTRVQTFRPRDKQPAKKPWMEPARKEYFNKIDMKIKWHKELIRTGIIKLK